MDVQIEKGILLPPRPTGRGSPRGWAFKMEVGDSVLIQKPRNRAFASTVHARRHGMKFSARSVCENGVQGTRIWRIE